MPAAPSVDNYSLGKGIVYLSIKKSDGSYETERDLGNAPEFSYSVAVDTLEHESSRGGFSDVDLEIDIKITPSLAFTLDEVNTDNLALNMLGNVVEETEGAGSVSDEDVTADVGAAVNLAHTNVSSVVVKDSTDTTTYTETTDYTVNTTDGTITVLGSGSISDGETLHVSYSYSGGTVQKINCYMNASLEGKIRFVSDNPAGPNRQLEAWRVKLTPNGDTALIGTDWSTLGFTGKVLSDKENHPESPYITITSLNS